MTDRPPRPKDAVKEFMRDNPDALDIDDPDGRVVMWLHTFAYWLEGQDRTGGGCATFCRYHLVPADQSPCPFEDR